MTSDAEELAGLWWRPASPEEKVAGILTRDENGRQELRLIGSFEDPWAGGDVETAPDGSTTTTLTEAAIQKRGVYPRIHGVVGAKSIHLEDCFQTGSTWQMFGGVSSEHIHVHQSFEGAHFEPGEDIEFIRMRLSLLGLTHWVVASGVKESITWKKDEESGKNKDFSHHVTIANVPDIEISDSDGRKSKFVHSYTAGGDRRTEVRFSQDFKFVVESNELVPLHDFLGAASALQDLLTIAVGRPAAFTQAAFRHPDIKAEHGDDTHYPDILMHAQWSVRPAIRKKSLTDHDLMFTLEDFGGPLQVAEWMKVAAEHQSTLSRVMSTKYATGMYVGDGFFSCAAALEAYDRKKHADKKHYQTRLKRCASYAGPQFKALVGDVDAWVKLVKDNRNTVAHHNDGIADATAEQVVLGESAFWLYVLCLLRDIDAPDSLFAKLAEHRTFQRLTKDVSAALAAA